MKWTQKIAALLQEDVVNSEDNRPNNEEIETENNKNNENNQKSQNSQNNQNDPNDTENEDPEEEVEEDIEAEGDEEGVEDTDSNPSGNEERKEECEEIAQPAKTTRSGRTVKPPLRYDLFLQGNKEAEYSIKTAKVIAKAMNYFNMHFWQHLNILHLANPRKLHLVSSKHLV
jgi:hypothetical protein